MTPRSTRFVPLVLLVLVAATACTSSGPAESGSRGPATASPSTPTPSTPTPSTPTPSTPASSTATPASAVSCSYARTGTPARPVSLPPATARTARTLVLDVSVAGRTAAPITIALTPQATPCTVNSIAHLAQARFYDRTRCHRLTTTGIYVLQCGDPTATGTGGPGYAFPDELTGDETYPAGTVAMANNGPDTNGSQFFLVYKDTIQLGADYTVFGRITGGMDVLDRIAAAGTAEPAGDGTPKQPVVITRATAS